MAQDRWPVVSRSDSAIGPRRTRTAAIAACAILVFFLALFASCSSAQRTIRRERDLSFDLTERAKEFNRLIKWRAYESAIDFIDPEMREEYLMGLDVVGDRLQIEEIQISHVEVEPREELADTEEETDDDPVRHGRVTIKLVNMVVIPSTQVITRHHVQLWIFKNGGWYVQMDLREFIR